MPPPLQAKLLRVLQEREIERVGGRRGCRSTCACWRRHTRSCPAHREGGVPRGPLLSAARRGDRAAAAARAAGGHPEPGRALPGPVRRPGGPGRAQRSTATRTRRSCHMRFPATSASSRTCSRGLQRSHRGARFAAKTCSGCPVRSRPCRTARRSPGTRRSRICARSRTGTSRGCCTWPVATRAGLHGCSESAAERSTGSVKWDISIL